MATIVARSVMAIRVSCSLFYHASRHFLSSTSSMARSPPLPGFVRRAQTTTLLAHSIRVLVPGTSRLNVVRCWCGPPVRPPTKRDPPLPGCDYEHWFIVMDDNPCGEGATKQDMIKCYIETLAKVVGSVEEAKKRIYNVSCERYFGFGCELDKETSNKLEGLPGIKFVLPDTYVDARKKDYGPEYLVNGEIVQRPPERKKGGARSSKSSRQTKIQSSDPLRQEP